MVKKFAKALDEYLYAGYKKIVGYKEPPPYTEADFHAEVEKQGQLLRLQLEAKTKLRKMGCPECAELKMEFIQHLNVIDLVELEVIGDELWKCKICGTEEAY